MTSTFGMALTSKTTKVAAGLPLLWIAAAGAAQGGTGAPRLERAVALERAAHDPAAALREYRAVIDAARSAPVRARAALRAGELLRGLGRHDEAAPLLELAAVADGAVGQRAAQLLAQDPVRDDELAQRIAEAIDHIGQRNAIDDLVWIGEPAVSALRAEWSEEPVTGLAAALLGIGGDAVQEWVGAVIDSDDEGQQLALLSAVPTSAPGRAVLLSLLPLCSVKSQEARRHALHYLGSAVPWGTLVELLGDPATVVREKAFAEVLQRVDKPGRSRPPSNAEMEALLARVAEALPRVGRTLGGRMARFVQSADALRYPGGRSLFLQQLTRPGFEIDQRRLRLPSTLPSDAHVEEVAAAVRRLGPIAMSEIGNPIPTEAQRSLQRFVAAIVHNWTEAAIPLMLDAIRAGYDLGYGGVAYRAAGVASAPDDIVALFEACAVHNQSLGAEAIRILAARSLPVQLRAHLLALFRQAAPLDAGGDQARALVAAIAATGAGATQTLEQLAAEMPGYQHVVAEACTEGTHPSLRAAWPALLSMPVEGEAAAGFRGALFDRALSSEDLPIDAMVEAHALGLGDARGLGGLSMLSEAQLTAAWPVAVGCLRSGSEQAWAVVLGLAPSAWTSATVESVMSLWDAKPEGLKPSTRTWPKDAISIASDEAIVARFARSLLGDPSVAEKAIAALAWRRPIAVPVAAVLREALAHADAGVVVHAARGLGRSGDPAHLEALRGLRGFEDRKVQLEALKAREQLGDDSEQLVRDAAAGADPEVRAFAAALAARALSRAHVPVMLQLLRDEAESVRTAAAATLASLEFYEQQSARWERLQAGVAVDAVDAASALMKRAAEGPVPMRVLAIESLGTLGVPETLPFLLELAAGADQTIAAAAVAAARQINARDRR